MGLASFENYIRENKVTLWSPHFYEKASEFFNKQKINFVEAGLFEDATGIQESASIRNVLKARRLAQLIVQDDGELDFITLAAIISSLKKHLYSLAKGFEADIVRDEHIVSALEKLQKQKELQRILKNIKAPFSHRIAEELIRATLSLSDNAPIGDAETRRACLAAWLTFLRQSLGSCFATAPAILVQQEEPHLLLKDLDEMMSTGRLKRTFGGVEYSVPISISWGNGDLKKPVIYKKGIEHAPGIVEALRTVGVTQGISHEAFDKEPFSVITAEELIEIALLAHHKVTKQEIHDFLNRPKTMIHSGLLLHVSKASKEAKGKQDLCALYLRDLDKAKATFKALADCALLKAWEFTIASFSEIKLDFARFNLYASLGINYDQPGGIGECLYAIISQRIEEAKGYLKEKEREYEEIAIQMQYLEQRIRQASTERELNWIKMEHQSRRTELYNIEQQRREAHEKAQKVAHLYEFLRNQYDQKFKDYFQEVYDPDIQDIRVSSFDDSPAGFRLLYKHGRTNSSQWTRIYSASEFIEALVSFFTITEQELSSLPEIKGIEQDFSRIVTKLVAHVRSDEFLESAFYRMAKAHNVGLVAKPLDHLDQVEKKPWVYTSGGSMGTLVSAYFLHDEKPVSVERWVESETELLAFLLETLRHLPVATMQPYGEDNNKSMLMHSPTHAFLLKPGYTAFKEGWTDDTYVYSWIKHIVTEPALKYIQSLRIEEEMAYDVIEEILSQSPRELHPRIRELFYYVPRYSSVRDFRDFLLHTLQSDKNMRYVQESFFSEDTLDSILYSQLPWTPEEKARDTISEILCSLFGDTKNIQGKVESLINTFWAGSHKKFIPAKKVYEITKALAIILNENIYCPHNILKAIVRELRTKALFLPQPVIFADSNWIKDYFAFVINPATEQLEFWSVDYLGITGRPISYWKMWLNGSRRTPQWGIYTRPIDYTR